MKLSIPLLRKVAHKHEACEAFIDIVGVGLISRKFLRNGRVGVRESFERMKKAAELTFASDLHFFLLSFKSLRRRTGTQPSPSYS